jgi:hypothetical protein
VYREKRQLQQLHNVFGCGFSTVPKILSNFPNRAGTFFAERGCSIRADPHRGIPMQGTIQCPSCGCEIAVSETLTAQINHHLRQEFDAESRRKDNDIAKRVDEIRQREQILEASRQAMEQEIIARVGQERNHLLQEAQANAKKSVSIEMHDLQEQLTTARNQATEAQKTELQLRRERRQLEAEKQALELTVNRTLDEERAKIRDQAKRDADEQHRLKEADKDKLIGDLRLQIDDLKRKSEQGSQQAQGEVMELELEELLRSHFPFDTFEPVPVGVHGGDVLHHVHDTTGMRCGTILWESKRTKAWNDNWLPKLRDDQRAAHAAAAVVMTAEMPKGLTTFERIDGVWVTSRNCLLGLATALRVGILEIGRTKRSMEGRQSKVELLFNYVAGSEFRQRIEGIVEAFITLKDDLESEKRSMQRLWAKREKQIERATLNTAGLYGDFGGILGPSLPQIANLELAVIDAESEAFPMEPALAGVDDSPF